jgi:hypothetical protein
MLFAFYAFTDCDNKRFLMNTVAIKIKFFMNAVVIMCAWISVNTVHLIQRPGIQGMVLFICLLIVVSPRRKGRETASLRVFPSWFSPNDTSINKQSKCINSLSLTHTKTWILNDKTYYVYRFVSDLCSMAFEHSIASRIRFFLNNFCFVLVVNPLFQPIEKRTTWEFR